MKLPIKLKEREVVEQLGTLTLSELRLWVSEGWVTPQENHSFAEIDVARVRLVCQLRQDLNLNDIPTDPNEQHLISSDGWAWGGPATMFSTRNTPNKAFHFDNPGSDHSGGIMQAGFADGWTFFFVAGGSSGAWPTNCGFTWMRWRRTSNDRASDRRMRGGGRRWGRR